MGETRWALIDRHAATTQCYLLENYDASDVQSCVDHRYHSLEALHEHCSGPASGTSREPRRRLSTAECRLSTAE